MISLRSVSVGGLIGDNKPTLARPKVPTYKLNSNKTDAMYIEPEVEVVVGSTIHASLLGSAADSVSLHIV